jgi:hypothetical protein
MLGAADVQHPEEPHPMNPTVPAAQTEQPARSTRRHPVRHFVRHFVEMVVAMLAGMFLLGPLWTMAAPDLAGHPDLHALVMATNMTIGMAAWMRVRGHGWAGTAEMSAAMYLPFLALLVPYWTGLISGDTLLAGGHLLMVPAMLAAMFRRLGDYTGH